MKQNRLIELVAKCTPKERASLAHFVDALYFNKDVSIKKLVHYLLNNFDNISYDKEKLHQIAYPNLTYDDKRYRYLISNSAKLISRFWLIEDYEANHARQTLDQLEVFSSRRLEKSYRLTLNNWERLSTENIQDIYEQDVRFHEIKELEFSRKGIRQFDPNIEQLASAYDRYYYFHRLSNACDMLNRETIFQGQYKKRLTPTWFAYLEEQAFFNDSLIKAYYMMWQMLNAPEEESYFDAFLDQIHQLGIHNNRLILREFYLAAVNYALRKLRAGQWEYREKALELYLEAIEKKVLLENGELSPWTFGNVVKLALKTKEKEWIRQFIEEQSKILPTRFQENALLYNLAELAYANQSYHDAQQALSKVTFSDLNYYLGARILLAKIYYENDETEPLLSLISSFSIFLKRNKEISTSIKQTCRNFCDILSCLVRQNSKKILHLETDIQETKLLAERDWLLLQYSNLKN